MKKILTFFFCFLLLSSTALADARWQPVDSTTDFDCFFDTETIRYATENVQYNESSPILKSVNKNLIIAYVKMIYKTPNTAAPDAKSIISKYEYDVTARKFKMLSSKVYDKDGNQLIEQATDDTTDFADIAPDSLGEKKFEAIKTYAQENNAFIFHQSTAKH
jgi:hypothetical protein